MFLERLPEDAAAVTDEDEAVVVGEWDIGLVEVSGRFWRKSCCVEGGEAVEAVLGEVGAAGLERGVYTHSWF